MHDLKIIVKDNKIELCVLHNKDITTKVKGFKVTPNHELKISIVTITLRNNEVLNFEYKTLTVLMDNFTITILANYE